MCVGRARKLVALEESKFDGKARGRQRPDARGLGFFRQRESRSEREKRNREEDECKYRRRAQRREKFHGSMHVRARGICSFLVCYMDGQLDRPASCSALSVHRMMSGEPEQTSEWFPSEIRTDPKRNLDRTYTQSENGHRCKAPPRPTAPQPRRCRNPPRPNRAPFTKSKNRPCAWEGSLLACIVASAHVRVHVCSFELER